MPRLLALPILIALLAPAAAAQAAPAPGKPGAIAFIGERGAEKVLYIRKGGRTVGRLREAGLGDATWSPLGRRYAITRELPDSGRAIWIFNHDGTGGRQLTASELTGSHATWAPAGRSLAFAAGPVGQRRVHTIRADGTRDREITTGPEDQYSPVWSSRDQIAFVAATPTGEDVFRVPSRGGSPRRLTFKAGNDTDPAWSPRGDRIAWVRGTGGIWVMSRWGNGKRKVVHVPGGIEQGVQWSPDSKRLVFAAGKPGRRQIFSVKLNGKGLRSLSLPSSNGEDPTWQSVGHNPLIAMSGDIGCPPTGRSFNNGLGRRGLCAARRTSDLLLQPDLWSVLVLGDQQYPDGSLSDFHASYGPSWGRIDSLARPIPGNHEYRTPGAAGYFDYYGTRAGAGPVRERGGYYSFDVGEWHIVALNSNCAQVPGGGCERGSTQQRWLERDLDRNAKHCTLAYWHHPLFSSLAYEEGRGPRETRALWETLHAAGADVIVSGHQHFYERLAPQDPNGNLDRAHGLRAFVVGTGGKSLDQADFRDANSQAFSADAYGVLELRLRPNGYDWHFRHTGPAEYFDTGRSPCH